jgi:hypothetical protein
MRNTVGAAANSNWRKNFAENYEYIQNYTKSQRRNRGGELSAQGGVAGPSFTLGITKFMHLSLAEYRLASGVSKFAQYYQTRLEPTVKSTSRPIKKPTRKPEGGTVLTQWPSGGSLPLPQPSGGVSPEQKPEGGPNGGPSGRSPEQKPSEKPSPTQRPSGTMPQPSGGTSSTQRPSTAFSSMPQPSGPNGPNGPNGPSGPNGPNGPSGPNSGPSPSSPDQKPGGGKFVQRTAVKLQPKTVHSLAIGSDFKTQNGHE